VTTGCELNTVPLAVVAGEVAKDKLFGAAAVMVNAGVLTAEVRPDDVAVTT
jgi:hypothetical protein